MLNFTRVWVRDQMQGFYEELSGVRPTLEARTLGTTPPPFPPPGTIDLEYARKWIPYSELNAARLLQLQLEDRLTFIGTGKDDSGTWYFWNGVYHCEVKSGIIGDMLAEAFSDQVGHALNVVHKYIAAEIQSARGVGDANRIQYLEDFRSDSLKEHRRYEVKLHSDAGLNALRNRFRKQCTKEPDYFEDDRRWLVCLNGVIDLDGFRKNPQVQPNFHRHEPWRPVTRAIDCDFNPEAKAPNWAHFLETSIPDPEIREFLQRLVGAAFMAESKVKAIPNLQGPKDCGKTIFVTALERLAGGYGIQPSPDALMVLGTQNWEQDTLRGKRFVGVSEPSYAKKLDDSFCKQVTGGDAVTTRTLHSKSSSWVAQCVMFIASNHPVRFNTQDKAFIERICLIKFPHQFYDKNDLPHPDEIHIKDYELEAKLEQEHEGIFLWVIMGMWKYMQYGVLKPDSVKRDGDQIVVDSSPALSWMREKIEDGDLVVAENVSDYPASNYALMGHLYREYVNDCGLDNSKPLQKQTFNVHIQNYYGEKMNSGGWRVPRLVGAGRFTMISSNGRSGDSGL